MPGVACKPTLTFLTGAIPSHKDAIFETGLEKLTGLATLKKGDLEDILDETIHEMSEETEKSFDVALKNGVKEVVTKLMFSTKNGKKTVACFQILSRPC